MEKDNIQKELFEFDVPKRRPSSLRQLFQKTDFKVSLSAEKLVFVSIGIIMLLVVFFALGVENGKAISVKAADVGPVTMRTPIQATAQGVSPSAAPAQKAVPVKSVSTVTNIAPKGKTQPYTIAAASFSKETYAVKEVNRLKGSGFEAFVLKSDPYYLVCIGSFTNKDSAKMTLNKIRQMYKDAYVRLR